MHEKGVKTIGIDSASLGATHNGVPVHQAGLQRGLIYIEGLTHLDQLPAESAQSFFFFPLKIALELQVVQGGQSPCSLKEGSEMSNILLRTTHITKHFGGIQALKEIDLELFEGEICALAGENGAGKSTLAKIIAGVQTYDSGDSLELHGAHCPCSRAQTMPCKPELPLCYRNLI